MSELHALSAMVEALCLHHGLLQWADGWAAGANEGGRYVSLFHSRLQYRVAVVYEEAFGRLPDFIREAIPDDVADDISTGRDRVEKAGKLRRCTPFLFTRWQVAGGGDDDKARWRFGQVVRVARQAGAHSGQPGAQERQAPRLAQPAHPRGPGHERGQGPVQGQVPASAGTLEKLHRLGVEQYGTGWPSKARELTLAVSRGRTGETKALLEPEAQRLIGGLEQRKREEGDIE